MIHMTWLFVSLKIKTKNWQKSVSTWSNASRKQEGRFSGSWLANRLWVSLDVRPYLLLFGDTLIRPPFSFWWFISICSGPQAENSTLKVKKVGYYPTIDVDGNDDELPVPKAGQDVTLGRYDGQAVYGELQPHGGNYLQPAKDQQ